MLERGPAALATLVAATGSTYRRPGARCLVLPDGRSIGSISGGCLEEDVRMRARQVLERGTPQLAHYDTAHDDDLLWGTGLGCGGVVQVFIEHLADPLPRWVGALREQFRARRATELAIAFGEAWGERRGTQLRTGLPDSVAPGLFLDRVEPPPSLALFGAGDDAQPLVALARLLAWHVSVFDVRQAYATVERFPEAQVVRAGAAEEFARHPEIGADSHVVVMSHRYRDDREALRVLLTRPLAYLGVLGPRARTERLLEDLAGEGVEPSAEMRARLFAPVGIDLGGASPETVALSIVAELQAVRTKRRPLHLRDRVPPIHG